MVEEIDFTVGSFPMKKIIHVITTIERGGAEKQLLILIQQQLKLGHEVDVIPIKGLPELEEDLHKLGARVHLELLNKKFIAMVIKLRRLLSLDSSAIVHAHLPMAELLSRIALLGLSNSFIVSRHNAEPFSPFLSRILSTFVTSRAHCIIAISQVVKQFLIDSKEITNIAKIHVVHYSFDPNVVFLDSPRNDSAPTGSLQLLTIGRLVKQKNYPFLLSGLSLVSTMDVDFRLCVLGSGPLELELKNLSKKLGIGEKIDWLGRHKDVQSFLKSSDALLMSSLYEGFGLVLLEAMQLGLPIIAPRRSTFPEVLGEDYPGLYLPDSCKDMAFKIESLRNRDFYSHASKQSLLRLNNFDPDKMAHAIEVCYDG
jgi:glycosyltransferase involved in cell wall biosynthesis